MLQNCPKSCGFCDGKKYEVHSGGSSVGQNKLLQLILGYIYILKHLQSNFIGKILFFGNS